MATIYELQQRLASLQTQRDSGVAKVSYGGRSVEYRTLADIDKAISRLNEEINAANGVTKKRTIKTYTSKGL